MYSCLYQSTEGKANLARPSAVPTTHLTKNVGAAGSISNKKYMNKSHTSHATHSGQPQILIQPTSVSILNGAHCAKIQKSIADGHVQIRPGKYYIRAQSLKAPAGPLVPTNTGGNTSTEGVKTGINHMYKMGGKQYHHISRVQNFDGKTATHPNIPKKSVNPRAGPFSLFALQNQKKGDFGENLTPTTQNTPKITNETKENETQQIESQNIQIQEQTKNRKVSAGNIVETIQHKSTFIQKSVHKGIISSHTQKPHEFKPKIMAYHKIHQNENLDKQVQHLLKNQKDKIGEVKDLFENSCLESKASNVCSVNWNVGKGIHQKPKTAELHFHRLGKMKSPRPQQIQKKNIQKDTILSDEECNLKSNDQEELSIQTKEVPFSSLHSRPSNAFNMVKIYQKEPDNTLPKTSPKKRKKRRHRKRRLSGRLLLRKVIFKVLIQYFDIEEIINTQNASNLFISENIKKAMDTQLKFLFFKGISTYKRIKFWKYQAKILKLKLENPTYYQNILHADNSQDSYIALDIKRTFPMLGYFNEGNSGFYQLLRILKGISHHFKEIGYCQGMNFFSAIILLILGEEEDSFWMVMHLLNSFRFKEFLTNDLKRLKLACFQIDCLVQNYLSDLHLYFSSRDLSPEFYASQWVITLFSYDLPIELVTKIFDLFLVDGWKIIFKCVLSILFHIKDSLMKMEYEEGLQFLKTFTRDSSFNHEGLLQKAQEFKVTNRMLSELEELYEKGNVHRVLLHLNPCSGKKEWIILPSPPQFKDISVSPQKRYCEIMEAASSSSFLSTNTTSNYKQLCISEACTPVKSFQPSDVSFLSLHKRRSLGSAELEGQASSIKDSIQKCQIPVDTKYQSPHEIEDEILWTEVPPNRLNFQNENIVDTNEGGREIGERISSIKTVTNRFKNIFSYFKKNKGNRIQHKQAMDDERGRSSKKQDSPSNRSKSIASPSKAKHSINPVSSINPMISLRSLNSLNPQNIYLKNSNFNIPTTSKKESTFKPSEYCRPSNPQIISPEEESEDFEDSFSNYKTQPIHEGSDKIFSPTFYYTEPEQRKPLNILTSSITYLPK